MSVIIVGFETLKNSGYISCRSNSTFRCAHCDRETDDSYYLLGHIKSDHQPINCQHKNCQFISYSSYESEHHYADKHCTICPYCYTYVTNNNYKTHLKLKHPESQCQYDKCDQVFSNRRALDTHIKDVHLKSCKYCLKCFNLDDYQTHVDTEHPNNTCNYCHLETRDLDVHVNQIHQVDCLICDQRLNLSTIDQHYQIRHNKNIIDCEYCEYHMNQDYADHFKTHYFWCSICAEGLYLKSVLEFVEHKMTHVTCHICKLQFKDKIKLKIHNQNSHSTCCIVM